MTTDTFDWKTPELEPADQILINEYERIGVALDALAYTPEFRELVERVLGTQPQETDLRAFYLRLLGLRKRGLLPRLYHTSAAE